jgi:hypothetical protein
MDKNRPRIKPRILEWLASHKGMISLREWWLSSPECSLRGVSKPQSATGEELRRRRSLLPSVLDKAFKGEL